MAHIVIEKKKDTGFVYKDKSSVCDHLGVSYKTLDRRGGKNGYYEDSEVIVVLDCEYVKSGRGGDRGSSFGSGGTHE